MKEAWREVVTGMNASCQPTNAVAEVGRCHPRHVTFICTAESWEEQERLVSGVRVCNRRKGPYIGATDLLAVLQLDKALHSDVFRQDLLQDTS